MLLNNDFLEGWERIVNDVEKDQVPIECVKKVIFRTREKKQKTINLNSLRKQGFDDELINEAVQNFINEHEDRIISMEFILDIEAVAEVVQPHTDELLKGI